MTANRSIPTWIQLIAILAITVVGLGCQPKDVRPGLWLSGESVEGPVSDWKFTDDVDEIFIQTKTWYLLPHSTTIWGAHMMGGFYIGSYGYGAAEDNLKRWEKNVARNDEATLRIDGKLYEVTIKRVKSQRKVNQLDEKYTNNPIFALEPLLARPCASGN